MTVYLADGNLLIALTVSDHVHHGPAVDWFVTASPNLATCPITEGTLLRFLVREGQDVSAALGVLEALQALPWHEFWADEIPYAAELMRGVMGHRQVTDAYLVGLARHHGERVVTLDRGLAALHGDEAVLLLAP